MATVDINRAGTRELQSLPGIGASLATRILERRATLGRFTSLDDLRGLPGLRPGVLDELRDKVSVEPTSGTGSPPTTVTVRLTTDPPADALPGYSVRAEFRAAVLEPDGARQFVPGSVVALTDETGTAVLKLPGRENLGPEVRLVANTPDGRLAGERSFPTERLEKPVELTVKAVEYDLPQPAEDPGFRRPTRVRGRVIDENGSTMIGRRQVVLWGSTGAGEDGDDGGDGDDGDGETFFPLVAAETDASGYFSGPYPLGEFTKARGTVALSAGSIATVPIPLEKATEDGETATAFPETVLLVVALPEDKPDDDCGCATATTPRNPDSRDLVNAEGTFSTDLGGGRCIDFTTPDRTLEEFTYSFVVRTTEPEIRGITLADEPQVDLTDALKAVGAFKPGIPVLTRRAAVSALGSDTGGRAARAEVNEDELPPLVVNARVAQTLLRKPADLTLERLEAAAQLTVHARLLTRLGRVTPPPPGRTVLDGRNGIDWDDDPTVYQAVTIAHGHLLRFKQEWVADGYSLGDLLYSLPLAPAQRKIVAIVDWERREQATRVESATATEQLQATLSRDRDITDVVRGAVTENSSGGSSSGSSSFAGGFGLGAIIPPVGMLFGVGGGTSSANSSSWQTSARSSSAYALNQLRDRTAQAASAVRSQRSSVVQSVSQGERSVAQTEIVANYNHCHAITIQYFQVLRHLLVRQRLTDVQECLFVPLLMSPFTMDKVLRWTETLRDVVPPQQRRGLDAVSRIAVNYADSDVPDGAYADELLEDLDGDLYLRFQLVRPKDENDQYHDPSWAPIAQLLGIDTSEFHRRFLRDQAQKDRVFLEQLGPRIASRFCDHLQIFAVTDTAEFKLPVDTTLLTNFRNDVPLYVSVRLGAASLPAVRRRDIKQIRIAGTSGLIAGLLLGTLLPAGSRVIVESGTMTYRTRHFSFPLFRDARIRNDLTNSDDVRISARVSPAELRNPRAEDRQAARELLEHLNERLEDYHQQLWGRMSPNRRYMLLDGFVAPNSGGRSVASVVDNELIGIVGNCLVLPVSRGYHLDPTYRTDPEDPESSLDLLAHYQPNTPIEPMRVALPTRGVYAESVMGSCNSCEFKEEERFWRWDEAPLPDALPAIQPLSTDSRRADPGDLEARDFPAPIVAMQAVPQAPDPAGLANLFSVLGKSDLFRDMAGLAGTQQNAAAALQQAFQTAQLFGTKAADLALQGRMAKDIDKSLRAIQGARAAGLVTDAQASELATSAIRGMVGEARPAGAQALTSEKAVQNLLESQTGAATGEVSLQRNGESVHISKSAPAGGAGAGGGGAGTTTRGTGSRKDEATAAITAFAARTAASPWKLDRAAVAARLQELVDDPDKVDQDSLNLCGPAVFVHYWLMRDPLAVVRFAAQLYDTGASVVGSTAVEPDDDSLLGQDYAAIAAAAGADFCKPADWMILGSLRDAENLFLDFEGRPDEDVSAATTPGEVADWFRQTLLYREVRDEGNFFFTKGVEHLLNLAPSAGTDIALLINAHMLDQANVVNGPTKSSDFILNAFPNHFIGLTTRPTVVPGNMVQFTYWSWGLQTTAKFDRDLLEDNYYGAVIAIR